MLACVDLGIVDCSLQRCCDAVMFVDSMTKGDAMTKTEKTIRGLLAVGFREVNTTSGKYRAFYKMDSDGKDRYYFVGRSGALRFCRTNTVSRSVSATDGSTQRYLLALPDTAQ